MYPDTPQFPDLRTSWKTVGLLLADSLKVSAGKVDRCMDRLESLWSCKWQAMGKYFEPDGRVTAPVVAGAHTSWEELGEDLRDDLERFAEKLATTKDRFSPLNATTRRDLVGWLQRELQSYQVSEVATNRTGTGTVTKLVLKKAEGAAKHYTGHVTEAVEFLQIVASRAVECLLPLSQNEESLTLSINPLDLFTISGHTTGWTSCLTPQSESRANILCYLCDGVTAITYVHRTWKLLSCGGASVDLPLKKWRQIVHIDLAGQSAICIHSYPNSVPSYGAASRQQVARLLAAAADKPCEWQVSHLGYSGYSGYAAAPSETAIKDRPRTHNLTLKCHLYDKCVDDIIWLPSGRSPHVTAGNPQTPCALCAQPRFVEMKRATFRDTFLCKTCNEGGGQS